MFVEYNVNPADKKVGDCVIRALTKALGMTWEEVYLALCLQGYKMYDMPSSNAVWGAFLRSKGFKRGIISDSCPDCYTIEDFCKEFPKGIYVIGTGSHAVTAIDGNVAIPTGGAVTPIALALAVNGEPRLTSRAIYTSAAVDEYGNLTSTAIITVPKGCCFSLSVRYVDATTDDATTEPTPLITVQNANLVIDRIA